VSQLPRRTPRHFAPLTRRIPAARSGLSRPESAASYARRLTAASLPLIVLGASWRVSRVNKQRSRRARQSWVDMAMAEPSARRGLPGSVIESGVAGDPNALGDDGAVGSGGNAGRLSRQNQSGLRNVQPGSARFSAALASGGCPGAVRLARTAQPGSREPFRASRPTGRGRRPHVPGLRPRADRHQPFRRGRGCAAQRHRAGRVPERRATTILGWR